MSNINNKNLSRKNQKGFSLMELAIATILTIIVVVILFSITTTGLKNGRFVEKLTDTSNLLSKKLADVYRDIPNEVKKLTNDEMQLGSINPATPIPGYFDLLNSSGCVLRVESPTSPVKVDDKDSIKTKGVVINNTRNTNVDFVQRNPKGFNPSDGIDPTEPTPLEPIDCSNATVTNPNQSMTAMFRRQWAITKDRPFKGDVTVSAVIISIDSNTVLRSEVLTKIDGN